MLLNIVVGLLATFVLLAMVHGALYVAKSGVVLSTKWSRFKTAFAAMWKPILAVVVLLTTYFIGIEITPLFKEGSVSFESVVTGAREHWISVIVIGGIVSLAIQLLVKSHAGIYHEVTWGVIALLLLVSPTWFWVANWGEEDWQLLALPPEGRSEVFEVPLHHHIEVDGVGFSIQTVYDDGTECADNCPDGQISYTYLRNELALENPIFYAFVRSR